VEWTRSCARRSLEIVQDSSVGGIAIGGLSVGETREEMHSMLEFLAPLYDDSPRPRFLLGVGDPRDLRKAIECGIDMLDCVLPTRNARHGSVWVSGDERLNLKSEKLTRDTGVIDEGCDCYACQKGFRGGFCGISSRWVSRWQGRWPRYITFAICSVSARSIRERRRGGRYRISAMPLLLSCTRSKLLRASSLHRTFRSRRSLLRFSTHMQPYKKPPQGRHFVWWAV
jgi:hypothetical protein